MAERVGFVPGERVHINDLGRFRNAQSSQNTRNLSTRYKTGTVGFDGSGRGPNVEWIFRFAAAVSGLVLWQVARMTLVGGTIGLAAALGLGTAARSLLYTLGGYDPLVVSLSVVLLMLVAFGAGLLPALLASRINPVRAHRWQ